MDYLVEVATVPRRSLAVCHGHVDRAGVPGFLDTAFSTVAIALTAAGIGVPGPRVASYRLADGGLDVAAGFPCDALFDGAVVPEVVPYVLPAAEVVTTLHVGPYDRLIHAYDALAAHALAVGRGLDRSAPMWEDYLSGPDEPAAIARTAVSWPLLPPSR